jgi:hypothetical protein
LYSNKNACSERKSRRVLGELEINVGGIL